MSSRTTGRVKIPRTPIEILNLAAIIAGKHATDGATSPFNAMVDFDWAKEAQLIAPCLKNHNDALAFAQQAELCYRQRDVDLPAITDIVKNSAGLLKSIYAKNPKKLSEWGISVDDSPQAKKSPASKAG